MSKILAQKTTMEEKVNCNFLSPIENRQNFAGNILLLFTTRPKIGIFNKKESINMCTKILET